MEKIMKALTRLSLSALAGALLITGSALAQPGPGRAQQQHGDDGRDHHEQCVEDVVGRDDARAVRGLAAHLDQRVHGHAVDAGK